MMDEEPKPSTLMATAFGMIFFFALAAGFSLWGMHNGLFALLCLIGSLQWCFAILVYIGRGGPEEWRSASTSSSGERTGP